MPNHITNVIVINKVSDERLAEILAAIKLDEADARQNSIDFNKLIPMPPELNIESSTRSERALELYRAFLAESTALAQANAADAYKADVTKLQEKYEQQTKDDPGLLSLGEQVHSNIQNHGAADWYSWCPKHWGTKWNAYGYEDPAHHATTNEIEFLTAWSRVDPILQRLSEKFPDAEFSYYWADEDIGANVGQQIWQAGEVTDEFIPDIRSAQAYELAAEVMALDLEEHGFLYSEEEGTYLFVDPDEDLGEGEAEDFSMGGLT